MMMTGRGGSWPTPDPAALTSPPGKAGFLFCKSTSEKHRQLTAAEVHRMPEKKAQQNGNKKPLRGRSKAQ